MKKRKKRNPLVWIQSNKKKFHFDSISLLVVDIGALPTAPRSAVDIDYSTLPTEGPFKALVANLSFEIDDEGLRRIFADLNVTIRPLCVCISIVVVFPFSQEQLG